MHRTQYIDYKSGKAKKNFNDDLEERRNESNSISDTPENKVEIIQIGSDKYKVEYSISEDISEKDLGVVDGNSVHSPIEGRFVLTKGSNDKPVKVNDVVKKGDVLCYIESMKVMNAIKSEFSGKIQKIYFRDGEDVYDDDILFTIKK